MKKALLLILIGISFPLAVWARPQPILLTRFIGDPGLANYWRLQNTTDSKGAVTLTNTNSVAFDAGLFSTNAADFGSGNSTRFFTGTSMGFNPSSQSWAMSVWVNFYTLPASGAAMAFADWRNSGYVLWQLVNNAGSFAITANCNSTDNEPTFAIATGTWINFIISNTTSTNTLTKYVNGIQEGTSTCTTNTQAATLNIGSLKNPSDYISAKMQDFAFFTRPLTPAEATRIASSRSVEGTGISR